jgi:hypothetical protein
LHVAAIVREAVFRQPSPTWVAIAGDPKSVFKCWYIPALDHRQKTTSIKEYYDAPWMEFAT